jgi:hypothetical protein
MEPFCFKVALAHVFLLSDVIGQELMNLNDGLQPAQTTLPTVEQIEMWCMITAEDLPLILAISQESGNFH